MTALLEVLEDEPQIRAGEPATSGWSRSTPYVGTAHWLKDALNGLIRLSNYAANWDGYGSPPLTIAAVNEGRRLILNAARSRSLPPAIRPVPGGGLQLEWAAGGRELEVGILPTGKLEFLLVLEGNQMVEGELPDRELLPQLYASVFQP